MILRGCIDIDIHDKFNQSVLMKETNDTNGIH